MAREEDKEENWLDVGDEEDVDEETLFGDLEAIGVPPEDIKEEDFRKRYAAWLKKRAEQGSPPA